MVPTSALPPCTPSTDQLVAFVAVNWTGICDVVTYCRGVTANVGGGGGGGCVPLPTVNDADACNTVPADVHPFTVMLCVPVANGMLVLIFAAVPVNFETLSI